MTPPSSFVGRLARRLLAAFGWKLVYQPPAEPKAIIVFYPHTSNWDFVIGIVARAVIGLPVHWAGKDDLYRWPFRVLFKRLGGIPVNRRERTGFVTQMAAEFARRERFYLAITPEGTRRFTSCWKSGFYRLALAAKVPLGLAFIDYPRREIGIMGYLTLSGDEDPDLGRIAASYAGRRGKYPEQEGRIAFSEDRSPG
ncbi:MAG TPA: 1-acyl-sn-glycerol-3-phosphate acyltransferase [Rhodocyclaceae bacterium]|nr:1-acyl-sn-glycerol-3-phosphate acyltransferase [Rhodocyclaceae bacterium]